MSASRLDRYRGCLLGGAVGDALGAAVEFDDIAAIRARFGPQGITAPAEAYGRVGAITDDTQMTIATAEGLLAGADDPIPAIWDAYQRWLHTQDDPDQRRAPGNTCLSALRSPLAGDRVARNRSKGCGGVMRAAPCGLAADAFRLGVESAALTHGHPSGHLSAGALALVVQRLADGVELRHAVNHGIEAARAEAGAEEVVAALEGAVAHTGDDVSALGQGWVGEEALAIAVFCALAHPQDFAAAVRLAANHSGDSDSTAAIAGNIMGAHLGVQAVPPPWLEALELREEIDGLATALYDRFAVTVAASVREAFAAEYADVGLTLPETLPVGRLIGLPGAPRWSVAARLDLVDGRQRVEVQVSHRMHGDSALVLTEPG